MVSALQPSPLVTLRSLVCSLRMETVSCFVESVAASQLQGPQFDPELRLLWSGVSMHILHVFAWVSSWFSCFLLSGHTRLRDKGENLTQ
ncbi:hypothetical protein PGIGA_G00189960, partial [Pangasianodon gigas]|nr:hypothetical protein [Pangasianodon gigas]